MENASSNDLNNDDLTEGNNMSISTKVMPLNDGYGKVLEKVILKNDLSDLTPTERVVHIKRLCQSLELNPLTQPIQIIEFDSWDSELKKKVKKIIPYVSKDGGFQLMKRDKISITKIESEILNGDLYVVRAYAQTPDGRTDCSTGAKSIGQLSGKGLENAIKIAETQAKRRVALSICGLGLIDESEIEDIKNAERVELVEKNNGIVFNANLDLERDINKINAAATMDELKEVFNVAKDYWKKRKDVERLKLVTEAKDKRKNEIENVIEFLGEIAEAEAEETNNVSN